MPGKVYTFGTFALTPANGVYVSEDSGMSPAKRSLTVLGQAGYRGEKVLRSINGSKVLTLSGIIYKETESQFIDAVDNFNKALMNEGSNNLPVESLQVVNSKGSYVYENVIAMNTEAMIPPEQPHNINWIPFQITFFIPKGFARSIVQTQVSYPAITSTPHSNSISIQSDTNPEPIIVLTFTTHSTITQFTFLNTVTNESITCSGLTIVDGDVIIIDTASKTVMQNTTIIRYSGVMPTFAVGLNNFTVSFAGNSATVASQSSYDGSRNVYGNNWLSQKFQVGGSPVDVSQISIMAKKIASSFEEMVLLDDFESGGIDGSIWTTSGTVVETGGQLRIYRANGSSSLTSYARTSGRQITGIEVYAARGGGGSGGDMHAGVKNGSNYIFVYQLLDTGDSIIRLGGKFGSGDGARWSSSGGTISIRNVGSDIEIRENGTLRQTLSGVNMLDSDNLDVELYAADGPNTEAWLACDNVYLEELSTSVANSDLTIRIETDTAGKPSGTLADADGSLTIAASIIGTDAFSEIIAAFLAAVTLSATTDYHLVIKQSGGDIDNYYQIKVMSTGGYASGSSLTSSDAGSNWTVQSAEDLFFKIYSPVPTSFSVGLRIDYYPSKYSIA